MSGERVRGDNFHSGGNSGSRPAGKLFSTLRTSGLLTLQKTLWFLCKELPVCGFGPCVCVCEETCGLRPCRNARQGEELRFPVIKLDTNGYLLLGTVLWHGLHRELLARVGGTEMKGACW